MADPAPLDPLPTIELGTYVHYKGLRYEVLGVVRHSETREPLVLYRPLYGEGALWVRPHAMFIGSVEVDGRQQPRFAREAAPAAGSGPAALPASNQLPPGRGV